MPPIVTLDPFESCVRQSGGRYCTGYASFVSDEPSPLLELMKEYSRHHSAHFNHTEALYGTCVTKKCKNFYNDTKTELRGALEACLNQSVWEQYKLKVNLEKDLSCQKHDDAKVNIGAVEIAVGGILLALVVCNAVGSLLEIVSIKTIHGPLAQFLLCFSIPRNWKRLSSPVGGADPMQENLKGIYGIRALSTTVVISGHAFLPSIIASKNPKFLEDQYETNILHILINGSLVMQIYLFLSAFLLVYNAQIFEEKHKITGKMLLMSFMRRWLRLTPSYAIVLAVTGTWLQYCGSGPLWEKIVVSEALDCRRDWWKHLLYINNYVGNGNCMPHTWYLAADTQLYCLGIIVVVYCQSPRARKIVLWMLLIIGMVMPALHTYFQDLDGVLVVSPTNSLTSFKYDRTFNEVYKRGHTNIPAYVVGIAFGYLIYHLQKKNFIATKYKKWRCFYWSTVPLGVVVLVLFKIVYKDGPKMALFYRVLISAFIKPFAGLHAGLIILGMIFKIESVYRGILEWPGWRYLARVSYTAFLLHMTFIRIDCGALTHPIHTSYRRWAETQLFFVVVINIAAFFFWLMVEAPLAQVVKTCFERGQTGEKITNDEYLSRSRPQSTERKKK